MATPKELYYEKRADLLIKHLKERHFDAYYCATKKEALEKALSLIPVGASVGWGGAASATQIGLIEAVRNGNYVAFDRETASTPEDRASIADKCLHADVFLTGANALSLDGEMVNIDGIGNRVAAIIYGPKKVLVIAGMNKVCEDLESAVHRARTVAAPMNQQRFMGKTPCAPTGVCFDCKSPDCICNQIVITRHCRPAGRIQFILVGEELGF
jgi:hypothetical protein